MCYISETTKVINLKPLPLDSATPKPKHGTFKQFQCIFPTQNLEKLTEQNWDWYRKKTSVLTGK